MDYVNGGEMFTHLNVRECFIETEVRIFAAEVLLALEHLHRLGIIYRDIKLENILLDCDGHIVLTDFGLSKEILPEEDRAYSFCGTIEYMAPEVIRNNGTGHDYAVDFWSLGVLVYELLTGASPFTVEGERNTQSEVSKRILVKDPPVPKMISPEAKDLIYSLLDKNPATRLGCKDIRDIKNHRFFSGLDWIKLANKDIPAPFKPLITNEFDTSNFAEEFTLMSPVYSPALTPAVTPRIFKGYSFISPSIIFGKQNAFNGDLTDVMQAYKKGYQPTVNEFVSLLGESDFFNFFSMDLSEVPLGDGSFSVCRRCVEKQSGKEYAVKIVSRRWEFYLRHELKALELCQGHPNIVKLHSVHYDKLHCYIVLELLDGGELLAMIRQRGFFTESEASIILKQVASAVGFMHSKEVVHRDLKPENIVFTTSSDTTKVGRRDCEKGQENPRQRNSSINTSMKVKVVDFGFARVQRAGTGTGVIQPLTTPVFTLQYAAPEVLDTSFQEGNGYDESCDLWSLGVILYAMLSGEVPFMRRGRNLCSAEIMISIQDGECPFDGLAWSNVSAEAKELVKGLLTVNAADRLNIEDVLKNPWVDGSSVPNTPLLSPGLIPCSPRSQNSFTATVKTLNRVARKGFHLSEVNNAPLAQRRRRKRRHSGIFQTRDTNEKSAPNFKSAMSSCSPCSEDSARLATGSLQEGIFSRSVSVKPKSQSTGDQVDTRTADDALMVDGETIKPEVTNLPSAPDQNNNVIK